jgi:hypothetical protein
MGAATAIQLLATACRRVLRLGKNGAPAVATEFNDIIPGSASDAMHIVGIVEIAAGLVVAVTPRFGGLLVAAWLGGIILSLLLVGGYGDIALRDFGLLVGAVALSRLASAHAGPGRLVPEP